MQAICDVHSHVYPPDEAEQSMFRGDSPLRIEKLLDSHRAAGIEYACVTNSLHYFRGKSDDECVELLKRWHDYAAEIQERHKDRIVVFASAVPTLGKKSHREFERAIAEYGFRGCFINSSHQRSLSRRRHGARILANRGGETCAGNGARAGMRVRRRADEHVSPRLERRATDG